MSKFKVGDKVYYPSKSFKVLTVNKNTENWPDFPLRVLDMSLTTDGMFLRKSNIPSIFHATPENHELLERLYGVEFEKPTVKPTSREIIQAMLARGDKCVPCWVSDDNKEPNSRCIWGLVRFYNNDSLFPFRTTYDCWKYATPFDPRTGEAITELPNE